MKPALDVGDLHIDETSTSQHFFVGNLLLAPNFANTTEASLVKGVNLLLVFDKVHVSLPYSRVLQTQTQ